jgi:outer membrane protein OmpA-like peptidoglycan-associated protein
VNIKIVATTAEKTQVTQFAVPLSINLGALDSKAELAYSSDGLSWKTISQLNSSELPADKSEGFYLTPNGDSVILTRHLTSFATKVAAEPVEITTSEDTLTVGEDFTLDVTGIVGTGHVWFDSTTPDICDVTSQGKVHPYAVGTCLITVAVAASGNFMDVYSDLTKFEITAAVVTPVAPKVEEVTPVAVAIPLAPVSKLLGSVYFTRSTWALDHNAYVALAKLLTSLKNLKNYSIMLVGHSDVSKGLDNKALSVARSKTVAAYLKKNMVVAKVAYKGVALQQIGTRTRVDDALNRRVEMWIITSNT